ncbi:MAG: hypothetical protein Q7S45_02565 [Candidatus Curtissbacteria bacterium]|nr:hypothetical protein [Candidatus Curtissbacteria bacterium]
MSQTPKTKASTQQHLDVEDITEDLVILKTGWVAMVMSTTAINFDLLSEAEQDATIYAFGAFLNSLTFPLEVLIRSKKADITSYFQSLEEAQRIQPNPDLKRQIQKYQEFIQATVQQKTVLDKRFYLIINYSPLGPEFKGFGKNSQNPKSKAQLIQTAKSALSPKRDHVIKQTARLGINTRQLMSQELIELFYDIYNPAPTGTQRVILDAASYTTPLVEPAIANPTPASGPAVEQELTNINRPQAGEIVTQQETNLRPVPPASTPASTRGELGGSASAQGGPPPTQAPPVPQPAQYVTAAPTQAEPQAVAPNPNPIQETGGNNQ